MNNILFEIERKCLLGDFKAGEGASPVEVFVCDTSQIGKDRFLALFAMVLSVIHTEPEESWSEEKFPDWFTSQFSKQMTQSEANAWRDRWRLMSDEERRADEIARGWSFSNWLYWLYSERRPWWYCGVENIDGDLIFLRVSTPEGAMFGSLFWLIQCCGGVLRGS